MYYIVRLQVTYRLIVFAVIVTLKNSQLSQSSKHLNRDVTGRLTVTSV